MKRICQRALGGASLCLLLPWLPLCLPASCQTNQPTLAELQPLQGTWAGIVVGENSDTKITITITGSSFRFHRDTNFWFGTTIMLIKPWHPPHELPATQQNSLFGNELGGVSPVERAGLTAAINPQQLTVTIKDSAPSQRDAIGKVVVALFKIEDGLLTIAAGGDGAEGVPNSFDGEKMTRYELRQIPPREKKSEVLKPR